MILLCVVCSCASFPQASVLSKMHILKDHVIPWFQRWRMGFGIMEEQGPESIHAHLMKLERLYQGIANDVERLKYIVKEHNYARIRPIFGIIETTS